MQRRRPGLWAEIALALGLITLATVLLAGVVFWLVVEQTEIARRTDLAESLSAALAAQLEAERPEPDQRDAWRRVLAAYQGAALGVTELYVVDDRLETLASLAGKAPTTVDAGLEGALRERRQVTEVTGSLLRPAAVIVTSPLDVSGGPVAALRVRVPLKGPPILGGGLGFVLAHTTASGAVVALFGWILFRRRLIRPILALQDGTRRIAGGDFGHQVRLEAPGQGRPAARELGELMDALNAMSGSLSAYRDRTAEQLERLEQANEELSLAQDALLRSERLAGVGRLAAGLAHEVGNPLAAVLGYVELLAQGLDDPSLRDPALERDLVLRSQRELERIHRIIRDLLDYARSGSGVAEDLDVAGALEEAAATVRPQPAFRSLSFGVQVEAGLPPVRMERDKLHQVLVTLLLNAAAAIGARGGGRVRLVARLLGGEGAVEIRCEDDGPGFSEVALERAFEPFFTTKEVGQGTGLGLATTLQVTEAAGGRVTLGNRPEGGAWVGLVLPAADGAQPEASGVAR